MAHTDFTLQKLKKDFGLQIDEQNNLFAGVEPVMGNDLLNFLKYMLAIDILAIDAKVEKWQIL